MSLCLTSGVEWAGLDFEMTSLTVAVGQSHFCQGGLVDLLEPGVIWLLELVSWLMVS